MSEPFSDTTIHALARQCQEPSWMTELRRRALAAYTQLPWPHPSDDIWRRTDVSLLNPTAGFSPVPPSASKDGAQLPSNLSAFLRPLGDERLLMRVNGRWVVSTSGKLATVASVEDMADGLVVKPLSLAAHEQPEPIRQIMEADGFTPAEQKLTSLNTAFHHDGIAVRVPEGFTGQQPVRLVQAWSVEGRQAVFPMTVITVGSGSTITVIDEYVSVAASTEGRAPSAPHVINGRIELVLEPNAHVRYVRLQRWDRTAREFLLQRVTLARGATLTMANLTLGSEVSKAHTITKLLGEHATTQLSGFVFGQGRQHVDQHTVQDHQAPHTASDLQFRAALQDRSRVIYTGLIRIAKAAKQTNAFKANHNLLLSQTAKAETIPMLEILADDVQCKHGASIGPIDEEHLFYLRARGILRAHAERLIVMGFVESIIQQVPFEPLQQRLREEIEGHLHQETSQQG